MGPRLFFRHDIIIIMFIKQKGLQTSYSST